MNYIHFTEESRTNYDSFKYDELSSVGMIWAAIMTLIALIQLALL
jgi:hypothetical protein